MNGCEAQLDVLSAELVYELGEHVERLEVEVVVVGQVQHQHPRRRLGARELRSRSFTVTELA